MKKIFILVVVLVLLSVGFIVYKNIDVPISDNPPVIINPGTENPGTENPGTENPGTENPGTENPGDDKPISIGIELDKDYIYF